MDEEQPLIGPDEKPSSKDDRQNERDNNNINVLARLKGLTSTSNKKDPPPLKTPEPASKEKHITLLQLFRFADCFDITALSLALICVGSVAGCYTAALVILGRLTSSFAQVSFAGQCPDQQQSTLSNKANNSGCPLGIDLNANNYDRLHSLCYGYNSTVATPVNSSMGLRQTNAFQQIHYMMLVGLTQLVTGFIGFYIFLNIAKRQTSRISILLFRSIIQRNMSFFDLGKMGHLNNKLFDNIDAITQGIGLSFITILEVFAGAVLSTIVILIIYWELALCLLCFLPFLLGGAITFSKLTARETMKELRSYSRAGQIAQEVFSSIRTVFSLNGQEFEKKRYGKELLATGRNSVRKGVFYGLYSGWSFFLLNMIYAGGFIFGLLLAHNSKSEEAVLGDIIVVVLVFAQCISVISYIGTFSQALAEAQGAANEPFQIIDEALQIDMNEEHVWDESALNNESLKINGDVVFENVNFAYPARQDAAALRGLTFTARVGETTAIVGASGSGKSTCVSLLLRFYNPASGSITVNGRPIAEYNLKQLRQHIGIVNQEPILFNTTIYENIRYGKEDATATEIEEAAKQSNAHNFIMRLPNRYNTIVGERGVQLSGGEKQRIALARALIKRPSLLLLDEATSALDNISEKIVQEALNRACEGRTTIVVAHRLATIENAHQIYVMDQGKVIEQGTHQTLMAKDGGKYQDMFKSQMTQQRTEEITGAQNREESLEKEEEQAVRLARASESARKDSIKPSEAPSLSGGDIFVRLCKMSRPDWCKILVGCLASVAVGMFPPIMALLILELVLSFKNCTYAAQLHHMLLSGFGMVLLAISAVLIRFVQFSSLVAAGSELTRRIRAMAFACLLRQEVGYYDLPENSVGSICNRLSSDALAVQQITGIRVGIACETLTMVVTALTFGILFNWEITLITAGCLFLLVIVMYIHVKLQKQASVNYRSLSARASSLTNEVIYNMRTVKQLSIEKTMLKEYSDIVQRSALVYRKYSIPVALFNVLVWVLITFTTALIYWRILILVDAGKVRPQSMIMVFPFATFFMQAVRTTYRTFDALGASFSGVQSFFDLFDRKPAIDGSATGGEKLADFQGKIEFEQVKFVYPSRPRTLVLKDFQLSITPGQNVALVGESGSGKSTVIQLLERFYDVAEGRVLLDGVDIRKLDIHWLRSCFGLVSQEPVLFDLTIAENIAYALENVPMSDIIEVAKKANIHNFIEQLPQGYETRAGSKGVLLSGGEKQRIAIARAFLRRPKVLLLDEATSAMDAYNEQVVQEVIERTRRENPNSTSLTIAHRLSTIRSCDLICVVKDGKVAERGNHDQLVEKHGIYRAMLSSNH